MFFYKCFHYYIYIRYNYICIIDNPYNSLFIWCQEGIFITLFRNLLHVNKVSTLKICELWIKSLVKKKKKFFVWFVRIVILILLHLNHIVTTAQNFDIFLTPFFSVSASFITRTIINSAFNKYEYETMYPNIYFSFTWVSEKVFRPFFQFLFYTALTEVTCRQISRAFMHVTNIMSPDWKYNNKKKSPGTKFSWGYAFW